jgi:hypothetical protein
MYPLKKVLTAELLDGISLYVRQELSLLTA